jgi:hypothetical protein
VECDTPLALPRLARSPWLSRVQTLYLDGDVLGQEGIACLVDCPHLRQLRSLALRSPTLDAGDVRVLAGGRLLSQLTTLTLDTSYWPSRWNWDDEAMRPRRLLGEDAVRALAESPGCRQLQMLDLTGNAVSDGGAAALAGSPYLSRLEVLWLHNNRIGDAGAAALAASPHLSGLQVLLLAGNAIGDAGARALAASPGLAGLKVLDLVDNPVGPAGAIPLAARFGSRVHLKHREEYRG